MEKQYATTSATPRVVIDVSGDLRVKGQDEFEVVAKTDDTEALSLQVVEDEVVIRCASDCTIRVPRQAIVQVSAAHGDAVIKALEGELNITSVDGSLELRNVGHTKIEAVRGELTAKNVEGNLNIETVSGDVAARNVQGDFLINGAVHGNLNLSDVGGNAKAVADGNIMLRLDPAPGHNYDFKARGNLFCRLPDDASVEISVTAAAQVMADLPGIRASAPVRAPYELTLGEGDAHITLSASGNVVLDTHALDLDMEDFDIDVGEEVNGIADTVSEHFTQQIDSQMRMIEDQLNSQLSSLSLRLSTASLSEEQRRRIENQARQASERATERARERVKRAQVKMEHKLAAAQRRLEQKTQARERASRQSRRGWSFDIPTPPVPPGQMGEPVSEDERLMILRMLEQKKISMEEADKLLSALEGNA